MHRNLKFEDDVIKIGFGGLFAGEMNLVDATRHFIAVGFDPHHQGHDNLQNVPDLPAVNGAGKFTGIRKVANPVLARAAACQLVVDLTRH